MVGDWLYVGVDDLRRVFGVGVDEVVAGVFFAVSFGVAVPEWEFEGASWWHFAAEFADAFLEGGIDGVFDGFDGGGVGFGDEDGE